MRYSKLLPDVRRLCSAFHLCGIRASMLCVYNKYDMKCEGNACMQPGIARSSSSGTAFSTWSLNVLSKMCDMLSS